MVRHVHVRPPMNGSCLVVVLLAIGAFSTGCSDGSPKPAEGPLERAGKKVDEAADATKDAAEDAAQATKKAAEDAKKRLEEDPPPPDAGSVGPK